MKPKIRIIALNEKLNGKQAKIMEMYLNHEYKRYEGIISAIVLARNFIDDCYGIETPDSIWDRIASEVVKFDINNNLLDSENK